MSDEQDDAGKTATLDPAQVIAAAERLWEVLETAGATPGDQVQKGARVEMAASLVMLAAMLAQGAVPSEEFEKLATWTWELGCSLTAAASALAAKESAP